MDNDNKMISSRVMEMKDLISGPLVATIDADTMSTRRYLRYLMEIAFESYDRETGEVGELRMLTFTYDKSDINGKSKQKISIPLLSLVPLPLLQIKEAKFDFDIQIIDAVTKESEDHFSFKNLAVKADDEKKGQDTALRVSLAPVSGEKSSKGHVSSSLTANMKVHVKMQQADLPGGLAGFLNMAANNVSQEDLEKNP